MKKIIALLLAVLMVLSMFAGCGKTEEPAPETDAPAPEAEKAEDAEAAEEKIEISFLCAQYSDQTGPTIQKTIDAFQAEHPNVHVNLEMCGWDTLGERITSMVGAQQAPDLYVGGAAGEYIEDELVYPVEDVISEELKGDFYPTFWENNIVPGLGIAYQIPFLASVRALYYNKGIFEEVGIAEAPKTWTEVEDACEKIKEHYNGEVYGWGLDGTMTEGQTTIAYYGWNNGGGYVDEEGNYTINCPENVEGLEWAKSLYDNGYTNKNPTIETRDDMQKLVAGDKMAMLVTACFFPALYPEVDLGIAAIPYNDKNCDKSYTLAVQDALIFFNENAKTTEDTPEKMEAIKAFVDFFYSADQYLPLMQVEGMLPATQSGVELLAEKDPTQAAYLDALEGARFYERAKIDWPDCSTGIAEADGKILTGQLTVQEALDEVQAMLDEGL